METTAPYNEEMIARYLLGELTDEQQVEIEDHAFADQQYMQNILAVESDLIDEYVRGEVPPDRLQKFERHFLASDERLRKVEFARALAAVASESQAAEVVRPVVAEKPVVGGRSWFAFLRAFRIRTLNPAATFSLAAAALVLVVVAAWLIRDGLRLRAQLGELRAKHQLQESRQKELEGQQRELEAQLATARARGDELAARLEQERKNVEAARNNPPERQEPVGAAPPSTLVALNLMPGLSRGGNAQPKLVISPAVRTVRLRVGIDLEDDYPRFGVELSAQGGRQIFSRQNLSSRATRAGRTVMLNLPAGIFAAGRYELSLKGTTAEGATEDLGYYYFEVTKK